MSDQEGDHVGPRGGPLEGAAAMMRLSRGRCGPLARAPRRPPAGAGRGDLEGVNDVHLGVAPGCGAIRGPVGGPSMQNAHSLGL